MTSEEQLSTSLQCGLINVIKEFCATHPFYIGPKLVPLLDDWRIHPQTVTAVCDHIQRFYPTEMWWTERRGRHKFDAHLSIHNRYH